MTAGERLRAKREERGLSAAELAQRVGRSESAVRNQENGTNGIPPALAKKYAQALGTTAAWILYGDETPASTPEPEMAVLPVLGAIQAGAWLAIDDSSQDEPETRPAARDRRYPHADQWLREVQGDSMNARNIFPGDFVHIVDLIGAGVNLNTGMIVEVVRQRDGGALREITLKEVEVTAEGLVLWPRSTNPRWSEPVRLDHEDGGDIEVQITGLLLAKITLF
jgi:SOS-response transcriptional repressor LexA